MSVFRSDSRQYYIPSMWLLLGNHWCRILPENAQTIFRKSEGHVLKMPHTEYDFPAKTRRQWSIVNFWPSSSISSSWMHKLSSGYFRWFDSSSEILNSYSISLPSRAFFFRYKLYCDFFVVDFYFSDFS